VGYHLPNRQGVGGEILGRLWGGTAIGLFRDWPQKNTPLTLVGANLPRNTGYQETNDDDYRK